MKNLFMLFAAFFAAMSAQAETNLVTVFTGAVAPITSDLYTVACAVGAIVIVFLSVGALIRMARRVAGR